MSPEYKKFVPEYKKKIVNDLVKSMDEKNTIMFASIKGLPARQFQKLKKQLSEEVEIKVVKKRALRRAIENSKKENIKQLNDFLKEDIALLITNLDVFELAIKLLENQSPVKAKAGQIAEEDIEIEAGTTDLPAGPAVSELGSLGLTVKVTNGKIEILENKVVVKTGQEINETAAGVMAKLDILPFSVGFSPYVAYDSESNKLFTELKVDKEGTLNDMKQMFAKAIAFASNIGYYTKETIGQLLVKASIHEKSLDKLISKENLEEKKEIEESDKKIEESKIQENNQEEK
jgi:large subunit ribosomal protein L10